MKACRCASVALVILASALVACAGAAPTPTLAPNDLDAATQTLIANAERVVFIIPFSHWDTDWHDTFANYSKLSDQNILSAIKMANANPDFKYTLEQVLFVQHFWNTYPQYHADLKAAVQRRQISFTWAGITQPETSLAAPVIQVRNLQMGQDWIIENFGAEYVPHSAWQSDAFGNAADFPIFLRQFGVTNVFIGRSHRRCTPGDPNCSPLPDAFYWTSPVDSKSRVLVSYMSYPTAWDAIHRLTDENAQITALRQVIDSQFARASNSKYILLPMGSDFQDPLPNLPSLVDHWDAADKKTVLVMSSPDTAFQYLATQKLPEFTVDMNPIWQSFYVTRPYSKIADKESAFYLTAADKFGTLVSAPQSSAWYTATINAHYDNVSGVGFDSVWQTSQKPRFEQTVATAANDLATSLSKIASGVDSSIVMFNPTSWQRSEIVVLHGDLPDLQALPAPVQRIDASTVAFRANMIPSIGYAAPTTNTLTVANPTYLSQNGDMVTLSNGLVSVTLDAAHGGAISSLQSAQHEFISGFGDDITYIDDRGDVYGSFFGAEHARESQVAAQITPLAQGPLLARAQAVFSLGGKPITKTITLRADDPLVQVKLQIAALPQTTALAQTSTTISTTTRLDDLGFTAFDHPIDNRPIVSGDVTYRREIFYPIVYWSDIFAQNTGLALITHGLQGLGGTSTLNLMLTRDVTERDEGVTDLGYHTLEYGYLPHLGPVSAGQTADWAYDFNQPLIPVWRTGNTLHVQLPFESATRQFAIEPNASARPASFTLLSAQNGIISDIYSRDGQAQAVTINYASSASTLHVGEKQITLQPSPLTVTALGIKY